MHAQDSLDYERDQYLKNQSGLQIGSPATSNELAQQNKIYKNFYKQQLDELLEQKNHQKRMERQKEAEQRNMYNQRMAQGVQAEKMKDLSYKNYYQMLLSSQSNNTKQYISPFHERDAQKQRLISNGVEVEKKRSDMWQEQQRRRNQEMKKNYRELLASQINEKYHKNAVDKQIKIKQQEAFNKITYTPQELAKFEKQRKQLEMQKYKEDLDYSSPNMSSSKVRQRSQTGPYTKNDFNTQQLADRHNPMVNPLPYNIQNPYILKQMQRKQQAYQQSSPYHQY